MALHGFEHALQGGAASAPQPPAGIAPPPATADPGAAPPTGLPMIQPQVAQRNLGQEWSSFLAKPDARRFLIQTGLNLMQPVGLGQSTLGHIAGAVGGGFEAIDRAWTEAETGAREDRALDIRETDVTNRAAASQTVSASARATNARLLGQATEAAIWKRAQDIAETEQGLGFEPISVTSVYFRLLRDPAFIRDIKASLEATLGQPIPLQTAIGGGEEQTATGPNGEKLVLRNGEWVDATPAP